MGIGQVIKRKRHEINLTQKELADKLNVTSQAVSRWEKDEVEPSIDTIKEMSRIFNCSVDDLFEFDLEKEEVIEDDFSEDAEKVLGVCEKCNKLITESSDLNNVSIPHYFYTGKHTHTEYEKIVLCNSCNKKRLEGIEKEKEIQRKMHLTKCKNLRMHSFIWSSLILLLFAGLAFIAFSNNNSFLGVLSIILGIVGFTFASSMILFNNCVPEMWMGITSWSLKLPGIILSLNLKGIFALIFIKIFLGIISFIVPIVITIFITIITMIISIFVYPFALIKNIKGEEFI